MNSKNKFIVVILITLFTLISCSKDEQVLTQSGDIQTIKKSPKRGLAYDLKDPADLDALKSGVSWWYNWYFKTTAPQDYYKTYQMEFIPMLWGHNSDADFTQAKEFILSHPEIKYLLVLNEPNLIDQANMTPYDAAEEWKKYESLVAELKNKDRTVYLVGPAMNWGTMSGYNDPVTWLDDFYTAYIVQNNNKLPQIDYLAFHWYDYGLEAQLDRLAKYGKKIWITEMANWNPQINSYEKQAEQMKQMVALCESRSDVFRYAWFIGRGAEDKYSNLFNAASGELNDLGKLYISLPY
ncbi:MAG: hypothetical protein D6830_07320 [Ignavibacteria bacterium]|nr:MAG: hypothetical protein D6830_07320 [Ignavibacteria bacterium]